MKNRIVEITFFTDGESRVEKAYVEYIGHTVEMVTYQKFLSVNGAVVDVREMVPMQVIVYVCRVISTGAVIEVKPAGVRYPAASGPVSMK